MGEFGYLSESVLVAIIGGVFTLLNGLMIAISRWLSHKEHKGSEEKVDKIIVFMNGGLENKIKSVMQDVLKNK